MSRYRSAIALLILLTCLSFFGIASAYGPETPTASLDQLKSNIEESLDLGNLKVEQTAITIAKEYPGEYNLNQVSAVYDALRKGWYYYSDPSYKDKYKNANRTLQDGKISNSIGMGDCDDFAFLMASLLESLQGSTRIIFAYDQDTRLNHAYAEVYLGKKGDPRVEELIGWLKDEYDQTDISGKAVADEVWLNLDYNSTFPGGFYVGEGHRVQREVVWQSGSRNSPKIVPIIDTMDSIAGWEKIGDEKGSTVSIRSVPSPKGKAIQIDFGLREGGWAGISKNVSGSIFSHIKGLNLSYYEQDKQVNLQLRLVYEDGTSFGYSWKPEPGNKWAGLEALFEDFNSLGPGTSSDSAGQRLDHCKVNKLEIICKSDEKDIPGTGLIIMDHIRGVMNIPSGSPWARAEEKMKKELAMDLAEESDMIRNQDLIESITLAITSLNTQKTLAGENALKNGLALLARPKILVHHYGNINKLAYSSDGMKLATASDDKTARIWDTQSGQEIHRLDHDDRVTLVKFNHDNLKIATASAENVKIWDALSGKEQLLLINNADVLAFAFSPDGKKIANACNDNTVRIWSVETGQELFRLNHSNSIRNVAFSPDGKKIATACSDNTARIWSVETGQELIRFNHSNSMSMVTFSPDGTKIATTCGENAKIWDVENGIELHSLNHNGKVYSVAFSPDGEKIATASGDLTAGVWDVETGQLLYLLKNDGWVKIVLFSSDGKMLATVSDDGILRILDTSTGQEQKRFKISFNASVCSTCPINIMFCPDSKELAISIGKSAIIYYIKEDRYIYKGDEISIHYGIADREIGLGIIPRMEEITSSAEKLICDTCNRLRYSTSNEWKNQYCQGCQDEF